MNRTPLKRITAGIAGLALFIAILALIACDAHGRTFWQEYVDIIKLGGYAIGLLFAFAVVLGLLFYAGSVD